MKQHSTSTARLWVLALVVVVLSPAPRIVHLSDASTTSAEATASAAAAAASVSFERRQRHHHRSHPHRNAGAAYSGPPRRPPSWCPHCRLQPPPQPPPLHEGEVDPRYGVEKRLVPTGPNPLHN